jgi:hypothetical protein
MSTIPSLLASIRPGRIAWLGAMQNDFGTVNLSLNLLHRRTARNLAKCSDGQRKRKKKMY